MIEPQFKRSGGFSNGLAAVEIGGKWGYIDHTGRLAIATQFDAISGPFAANFDGALARARRGDEEGTLIARGGSC